MTDVFISYSRRDGEFAKRLTNRLAQTNRDIWIDWEDIPRAADWLQEIFAGIESAETFVFITSRNSLTSEICNYEVKHALDHNKRIIPLIREDVFGETEKDIAGEWFNKSWEQTARNNWDALKHLNWIFFNDDAKFEDEFAALVAALEQDLPYIKTHTRLLIRAKEWETSGRNPSLLLTGDEITEAERWVSKPPKGDKQINPDPTALHHDYIAESRKVEDERKRIEAERLAQIDTLGKRTRQFRLASVLLGILIVLALVGVGFAVARLGQAQDDASQANTQVAVAGETLTPVSGTLEAADANIAQAQIQVADALTEVANAQATLTPVDVTLNAANALVNEAEQSAQDAQNEALTATIAQGDAEQAAQDARNLALTATIAQGQAEENIGTAQAILTEVVRSADLAQTSVAVIGATLTPVESTLSAANAQVASANEQVDLASTAVYESGLTLTPIPPTLTQAAEVAQNAATEQEISVAFAQASLNIQQGDTESGLQIIDVLVGTYPDRRLAWMGRALIYEGLGEYDVAFENYTHALEIDPNYAAAYVNRGGLYETVGDNDAAIADYTRAISIDPEQISAYYNLALINAQLGNYDVAIAYFDEVTARDPDSPDGFMSRGLLYMNDENYHAAIPDFDRVIMLSPDNADAYYQRGLAYSNLVPIEGLANIGENAVNAITDWEQAQALGFTLSANSLEVISVLEEILDTLGIERPEPTPTVTPTVGIK